MRKQQMIRFNPLTGIRSFLTILVGRLFMFQSPHGDSFFSDGS